MNEVSNFCTGQVCSITASASLVGSPGDSFTHLQQASCCGIPAVRLFRQYLHTACLPWQQADELTAAWHL